MKKLLIALAAVLVTAASYAQGTINFNTRFSTAGVDAPVILSDTLAGPGPSYSAALYLQGAGGALTLIPTSVTTFRDGSANALFAKYINPVTAEVPGVTVGPVTVVMRAWLTSQGTYENATFKGESGPLVISTLGGGPTPAGDLPSNASGFTGFTVTVPEPSTIALGVLGAAALLIRRRK